MASAHAPTIDLLDDDDDDDEVQLSTAPFSAASSSCNRSSNGIGSSMPPGSGSSTAPLLLDDEEEAAPIARRPTTHSSSSAGGSSSVPLVLDNDDDNDDDDDDAEVGFLDGDPEVEEVEAPPKATKKQRVHIDDDLEVTGTCGGTFLADLPHSRGDCPLNRFHTSRAKITAAGNAAFCGNCWCFVCQVCTYVFCSRA